MFRLLVAILYAALLVTSGAQDGWHFVNPLPHGNNVNDMGLSHGVIWQVGDRGSVHTSTNLQSWTARETGVTNALRGITFFQDTAYISGEAGLILSATNTSTLTARSLNTSDWLEAIAASSNAIVAVGDNGAIYTSTDGETWSRRGSFSSWLRGVAFGNGQFLAAGEDGFIATSPDGLTWTERTAPRIHFNRVEFIDDRFWVVGEGGTVLTNTPAMTFSRVDIGVTNNLYAVTGNSSEVVIAGEEVVMLGTPEGTSWSSQTDLASTNLTPLWPYYSAIWTGEAILLGGRTGMTVRGNRTNGLDTFQWVTTPQPTRSWLWSVTQVEGIFAATGADGTIVTSVDGVSWSREVVPAGTQSAILLGIGGNARLLVAAGTAGTLLTSTNIVTNGVSLFGVLWNSAVSGTGNDLQGVTANNGLFVVTGARGTILTSTNGVDWQTRAAPTTIYLSGVTAFPGGFVACGDDGVILRSPDGESWSPQSSGVTSWVYSVRYANGRLVAVGEGGLVLTSEDGTEWTKRSSGTSEWINDVAYVGNRWYASAGNGVIITSLDAIEWSPSKSPTSRSLYGLAADSSQIIAVGLEGVILRQQLFPPTTPVNILSLGATPGSTLFLFAGATGQRFALESRENFSVPWQTETELEITASSGTLVFQRTNVPEQTRFFRTRLVEP